LFGSVSTRDIAALLKTDSADVGRSQIMLNAPIKTIGQYKVPLALHPEVEVSITVTVARSADEAQRIARGEDVTVRRTEAEEDAAAAAAAAEAMFDPEAKTQQAEPEANTASPDTKSEEAPAKPAKAAKTAKARKKTDEKA
jgi:large subunit ribosomal protein L9